MAVLTSAIVSSRIMNCGEPRNDYCNKCNEYCLSCNIYCIICNMDDQIKRARQTLFGTRTQTCVLILIELLSESYPSELARLSGANVGTVSRHLDALESEGITVSRKIGVERRVSLNPRFVGYNELGALLARLTLAEPELVSAVKSVRRRPRRRGKEI